MPSPEQLSPAGRTLLDRRGFLSNSATALGSIALTNLLETDGLLAANGPSIDPARPYAPRQPHFPARAKNVVVIFCAGAVSQLETWDYKPELIKWDDKPLPGGPAVTFQGPAGNLARPQYAFRPRGQTGKWVSDMIPHLAELTDDFAFVHSLTSKSNTHGPAENFLSTGFVLDGFPSLGSWTTYALGSDNQDLPSYVAIPDPRGVPQNGANNWGPGFLPAAYQGTTMSSKSPVRHLAAQGIAPASDQAARHLLQRMNARHLEAHPGDGKLATRIASYELAARMQLSVPEIHDLSTEPPCPPTDRARGSLCATFQRCLRERWKAELGWPQRSQGTIRCARIHFGPTGRSADPGPQATRPTSGYTRRLVHRVRPHAILPKRSQRTRPQSRWFHLLDDGCGSKIRREHRGYR